MVKKFMNGTIEDPLFKKFIFWALGSIFTVVLGLFVTVIKLGANDHFLLKSHTEESTKVNSEQSEDIKNLFRNQQSILELINDNKTDFKCHESIQEQWQKDLKEKVDKIDHKLFRGEISNINIRDDKPTPMF